MTNANEKIYLTLNVSSMSNTENRSYSLIARNSEEIKDKVKLLMLKEIAYIDLYEPSKTINEFVDYYVDMCMITSNDVKSYPDVIVENRETNIKYCIRKEFTSYSDSNLVMEISTLGYYDEGINPKPEFQNNVTVSWFYKKHSGTITNKKFLTLIQTPYSETPINTLLEELSKDELAELLYITKLNINPDSANNLDYFISNYKNNVNID